PRLAEYSHSHMGSRETTQGTREVNSCHFMPMSGNATRRSQKSSFSRRTKGLPDPRRVTLPKMPGHTRRRGRKHIPPTNVNSTTCRVRDGTKVHVKHRETSSRIANVPHNGRLGYEGQSCVSPGVDCHEGSAMKRVIFDWAASGNGRL